MSCVAENSAVFHHRKIFFIDNLVTARNSHKEITDLSRFVHRHYIKTVHHRFNRLDRIDLRNDNPRAKPFCPHGSSLAAPAVAGNYNDLSRHDQVCGTVDTIPYGLPRPVTVIKEMLAVRVVYHDHGELQLVLLCHRSQADNAGGRLLAAADHVFQTVAHGGVQHVYQVAAVVDDNVAVVLQNLRDVAVVLLLGGTVPREYV